MPMQQGGAIVRLTGCATSWNTIQNLSPSHTTTPLLSLSIHSYYSPPLSPSRWIPFLNSHKLPSPFHFQVNRTPHRQGCTHSTKFPIKPHKSTQPKYREVRLLLNAAAPVPRRGQPPINARSCVEKVVCPTPIESVPEKVGQDQLNTAFHATKRLVNVRTDFLVRLA